MAGSVGGALKREQHREPRNNARVAVNLSRDVLEVLQELAGQQRTTAVNYVRNMIELRVARVRPDIFGIANTGSEVVA